MNTETLLLNPNTNQSTPVKKIRLNRNDQPSMRFILQAINDYLLTSTLPPKIVLAEDRQFQNTIEIAEKKVVLCDPNDPTDEYPIALVAKKSGATDREVITFLAPYFKTRETDVTDTEEVMQKFMKDNHAKASMEGLNQFNTLFLNTHFLKGEDPTTYLIGTIKQSIEANPNKERQLETIKHPIDISEFLRSQSSLPDKLVFNENKTLLFCVYQYPDHEVYHINRFVVDTGFLTRYLLWFPYGSRMINNLHYC